MKKVAYLGEHTGDNMLITPDQLLGMVRDDIVAPNPNPVRGLLVTVVREDAGGTLHLDNFRCGLPKFVEVAVTVRTMLRTLGVQIADA